MSRATFVNFWACWPWPHCLDYRRGLFGELARGTVIQQQRDRVSKVFDLLLEVGLMLVG